MRLALLILIIPFMISVACSNTENKEKIQNKTDEKIEFYKNKIETDPKAYAYYNRLAQAYIQKARETGDIKYYGKAELSLEQSLKINPENYFGMVSMARVKASEHDFKGALEYAKLAAELYPDRSYAYGVIGDAYLELGQHHNAEIAYNKMIELRPGLDSYSRMSNFKIKKEDYKGAISAMEKAYESGIKDAGTSTENLAWTQVMLGSIYLHEGDEHRAEKYFYRAVEIMPDYFLALKYLAEAKDMHGHSH